MDGFGPTFGCHGVSFLDCVHVRACASVRTETSNWHAAHNMDPNMSLGKGAGLRSAGAASGSMANGATADADGAKMGVHN